MSVYVVISVHGNDLKLIGVCFNFPLFFESVDAVNGYLCGKGAVIWMSVSVIIWVMSSAYAMLVCVGC